MRGFVCTAVLLLALVAGASCFARLSLIAVQPCPTTAAASLRVRTCPARTTTAASAGWTRRVQVDRLSREAETGKAALAAAPRGGVEGGDGGEELEKKAGIEPKYLAAIVVFLLAAAYDLFVTHEGRLWEL
eukprot:g11284.t1